MSLVATTMAEASEEFAVYTSAKIDVDVLKSAKAAAALDGVSIQEWLSDLANVAAAKRLGHKPVKRKPPKPRARGED